MGVFAKVVNGVCVNVIECSSDSEGVAFLASLGGVWIESPPYGAEGNAYGRSGARKNYAGIGYTYDQALDAFIPPKPFPSWLLNEETCLWYAPVPMPDDGNEYRWDESTGTWEMV